MARPFPVLYREGVQRQRPDPQSSARLDGVADRVDTSLVSGDTRHVLPVRPATVAIHDDRDMRGKPLRIDCFRQQPVLFLRLQRIEESLHA